MRITSCLIAFSLLAALGLDAKASDRHGDHRGYSGWHGGDRGHYDRGYSNRGYYYHGYGHRYYGGYGPRYYGGTSFYFGAPIYPSYPYYGYYSAPAYPAPRPVYRGREVVYSQGSLGMDVQSALRRRGYYSGPVDGEIGPMTRSAIRAYQRDHDLRETGTITTALLERLGL
jgi:hypothetical protein